MYYKDQGFTLIELIVVLAVLAIVAVTATPTMTKVVENHKLKTSVINLKATILEARARALLVQQSTIVCPDKNISTPTVSLSQLDCGALLAGYDDLALSQQTDSVMLASMDYKNLKFSDDSVQNITFDRFGKTTQQAITMCNEYRSFVVEVFIPGNLTITETDEILC